MTLYDYINAGSRYPIAHRLQSVDMQLIQSYDRTMMSDLSSVYLLSPHRICPTNAYGLMRRANGLRGLSMGVVKVDKGVPGWDWKAMQEAQP